MRWSDGNTNNPRTITVGMSNSYTAIFTNFVPLETVLFKQWEQSFGGTGNELFAGIQQTSDGGYVLGAASGSGADGNKTMATFGSADLGAKARSRRKYCLATRFWRL